MQKILLQLAVGWAGRVKAWWSSCATIQVHMYQFGLTNLTRSSAVTKPVVIHDVINKMLFEMRIPAADPGYELIKGHTQLKLPQSLF